MERETDNQSLRRLISEIANSDAGMDDMRLKNLRESFKAAFLQQGFSTDDNLECMRQIFVGRTNDGTSLQRPTIGYCLEETELNIADVLNGAEGSLMPEQLKESHPELTQLQWDATLRMATMFFVALQGGPVPDGSIVG